MSIVFDEVSRQESATFLYILTVDPKKNALVKLAHPRDEGKPRQIRIWFKDGKFESVEFFDWRPEVILQKRALWHLYKAVAERIEQIEQSFA